MAVKSSRRPYRRALLCGLIWAFGFAFGFLLIYLSIIHVLLDRQMEAARWAQPSRVYARPLVVTVGRRLSSEQLHLELKASAYRLHGNATAAGQYSHQGGRYKIYNRRRQGIDDTNGPHAFEFRLEGGRVVSLSSLDGRALSSVRLNPALVTTVYAADRRDRQHLAVGQLPPLLVAALQATEDRNFKHHSGLAWRGIARAAWRNLQAGRIVEGGSTLTQQLVRSWFLSRQRSWWRKFNEAALALMLEVGYAKADILEAYCNEVYWGQQGGVAIHGVARAATFYFAREVEALEAQHIALLVGMLRGPSYYNPWRYPQRAVARRNQVLNSLYRTGVLSRPQATALAALPLGVRPETAVQRRARPAFVDLVQRQLTRHLEVAAIARQGLIIHTSMSPWHQAKAEATVAQGLTVIEGDLGLGAQSLQAAMVVAERHSGMVLAAVGARQVHYAGFNRVLDARRQVGSMIKPLIYFAALAGPRYHLLSRLQDRPFNHRLANGEQWAPANFDRHSRGAVPLLEALALSLNQATASLGLELGVARILQGLRELGWAGPAQAHPAALLGALEASPAEVTQWYLALANDARPVALGAVRRVLSSDGQVMYRYQPGATGKGKTEAAFLLRYALRQVVRTGTGRSLSAWLGASHGVAGKTGTTDDLRDSWFVAISEDLVSLAWVGRDDDRPAGVSGAAAALPLVGRFLQQAGWLPLSMDPPPGVQLLWVVPAAGKRSQAGCVGAELVPFTAVAQPQQWLPCVK